MKPILIIIGIVVLFIVVGVGAFFAGDQFGPSSQARNIQMEFLRARGFTGGTPSAGVLGGDTGQQSQGQRGQAGRSVANGTVKGVQGNTITVAQRDGSTATVTVDDKTIIQKTVNGVVADIQPGMNITVLEVTVGSGTTRRIQLMPGQ